MPILVFLVSLLMICLYGYNSVWAGAPQGFQIIPGLCSDKSHIAEGSISDELTKHQRPVSCNFAAISNAAGDPRHIMIQFGQSGGKNMLGFGGYLLDDGVIMSLARVYFMSGQETPVTEGACKFFFAGQKVKGIACGANIVNGVHKVVPIIEFEAAPY